MSIYHCESHAKFEKYMGFVEQVYCCLSIDSLHGFPQLSSILLIVLFEVRDMYLSARFISSSYSGSILGIEQEF